MSLALTMRLKALIQNCVSIQRIAAASNAKANHPIATKSGTAKQLPTSALPWHAAAKQPTLDLVSACAALTPVIGAAQKNEHQREPAPSCADDGHGVLGAS